MNRVAQELYGLKTKELAMAGLIKFHLGRFNRTTAYEKVKVAAESADGRESLIQEATQALEMSDFDTGAKELQEATYLLFKYGNFDELVDDCSENFIRFLNDCAEALKGETKYS